MTGGVNSLIPVSHTSIFLSGNFSDTGEDIMHLKQRFDNTGFDVQVKINDSGPSTKELIETCDYFMCLVGTAQGVITTPMGDSLPQLELKMAIQSSKKIIPIIKSPSKCSDDDKQNDLRRTLLTRYGRKCLSYESFQGLDLVADMLIASGVEQFARQLMPIEGFVSYSHKD